MITKILSSESLAIIDSYLNLNINGVSVAIPYFNNKKIGSRAGFRANIGKGSTEEISDEVRSVLAKSKLNLEFPDSQSLHKILVENGIGIDCSGFVYYVLNADYLRKTGRPLYKDLHFINCTGFFGKLRCKIRPIENCSVNTLADNSNSKLIELSDIQPGDIICMIKNKEQSPDHILVIYKVDYTDQNEPVSIYYAHAAAYPEEGLYGTGIKRGVIEIFDRSKPLTEQKWIENNTSNERSKILDKAINSNTELRRLLVNVEN